MDETRTETRPELSGKQILAHWYNGVFTASEVIERVTSRTVIVESHGTLLTGTVEHVEFQPDGVGTGFRVHVQVTDGCSFNFYRDLEDVAL